MMKRFTILLILFVVCALHGAEQVPFLTIPWKPVPDQTELFAGSGKMYDISCNEYALTLYARELPSGGEALVLIAPGNRKQPGYLTIRCKALPKRSLKADFRMMPDLFAENIEAEMRLDGSGRYVYRITVPWENLSTILPEKDLRLVIGETFLPLQMPKEYTAAKRRIEGAIFTAFQQKTFLKINQTPEMSYRDTLEQYLNMIEKDPAVQVRYLRAVLAEEVKP